MTPTQFTALMATVTEGLDRARLDASLQDALNHRFPAGGETYRANMHDFWIKRKHNGRIVRVEANQESVLQPGDTVIVRERYF